MDKVLDKATNTSSLSLSRSFSTLHKERISQPDKSIPQVIPRITRIRKVLCLAYLTPPSHPACSSRVRPQPKVPPIRGISCRTEARCKELGNAGCRKSAPRLLDSIASPHTQRRCEPGNKHLQRFDHGRSKRERMWRECGSVMRVPTLAEAREIFDRAPPWVVLAFEFCFCVSISNLDVI
jgi:hypothetical protein